MKNEHHLEDKYVTVLEAVQSQMQISNPQTKINRSTALNL
jgi:hypothetical protein